MIPNQSALPASSLRRVLIALVTFTLLAVSLTSVAIAKPGSGNSEASAACDDGGYVNWTRSDGTTFKNEGACVKYAAQGGAFGALFSVGPFSVLYTSAGSGSFNATMSGTGLEPSSLAQYTLLYPGLQRFVQRTADSNGAAAAFTFSGQVCAGIVAVSGVGTAAGSFQTIYFLPLPPAPICP